MKFIINKEFDGKNHIGSCENLPGCYVQVDSREKITPFITRAIEIYIDSYRDRKQKLPNILDMPVLNKRIRFNVISSQQLCDVLFNYKYSLEYNDQLSILLLNSLFPFNRIHLPNVDDLSPIIVAKIFGVENLIYMGHQQLSTTG